MKQMEERKMTIIAKLNRNCATLENMQGMKWKFENCRYLRSAIAIMVAETIWNQFDTLRAVSEKFEMTLSIELKDE